MAFELTSTAFAAGEPIPQKYICDGQDISPPLQWGDAQIPSVAALGGSLTRCPVRPTPLLKGRKEQIMSFVITLYVREGIVMASDSRLTLNTARQQEDQQIVQVAVGQSDSNYKTFLAPNNIGISTYGAADIQGVPIAGYIESFISERLSQDQCEVDDVPQKLLDYFNKFPGPPDTQFHVAGYKTENNQREQHVWHVAVSRGIIERKNLPGQQGATWGGEADILARLVQPVGILDKEDKLRQGLPHFQIPWQFFTLQDAIDYAVYAVKVTIDTIRFQPRPKAVGGPIDVLVIKPNEAFWVQRKQLHG